MPNGKNRIKLFLVVFALIAGFCHSVQASAQEIPAEDVVFLVDSSESAFPLLPAIAGIMNRFIGGAATGDSFTCYQFSNNPVLFAKGKIAGGSDIKSLQAQLLNLRETGRFTNYSSGLQKALTEISDAYRRYPLHDRLLVAITDGRSPDDRGTEKSSLMSLLQTYSRIRVGSEYFFTCFYIGDKAEDDLQSFLNAAGARLVYWPKDKKWLEQLTLGEVRVVDREKNFGGIPETPAYSDFSLSFFPRRVPRKLTMIELDLEENFLQQSLDRLFDIRPRRVSLREQPWSETFALETRGFGKGDYKGRFVFRPSEPRVSLLYPYSIPFKFSVSDSLQVLIPRPLTFGPTGLSGSYEETKSIYISPGRANFAGALGSLEAKPAISLPEGLRLNISPVSREKEIVIYVTLSREEGAPKLAKGRYDGTIRLTSPAGWLLSQKDLPISVLVGDKPTNYRLVALYAGAGVAAVLLGFVFLFSIPGIRRGASDYLARKAHPSGKLIVVKDPTRELAKTFNLAKISERGKRKEVLVGGTGENADIEVPHISMVDKVFRFTGLRTGYDIQTFVEVTKGANQVMINGVPRVGKIPLKHLDHIKLGSLEFRYEEALLLQQVVLYYLSGGVKQGWLLDWNTKTESFRLLLRESGSNLTEMDVQFHELKAVAFLRDFEGDLTENLLSLKIPRQGHLVKILFADEEELTGYVFDWKDPGDKFYFLPKEMGLNIMFFLIERNTLKEMKLLADDELAARQGAKKFAGILKKMSWVSE